jgi:hypothetical protein
MFCCVCAALYAAQTQQNITNPTQLEEVPLRRIFLACLTCLIAIAALALAWVPAYSEFPSGLVFQETLPPEGWTVCEVGGFEYIQEVNEARQVFTVCNAEGWRIKVYCTQIGVPAPESGAGCSLNTDGYYWCGNAVQILKFLTVIEEPTATDTPTPTNTPTPTDSPTPTPTDTSTATPADMIIDTDTPTPTGTLTQTDTFTPTPTGTITQTDTSTVTNTPTRRSNPFIVTIPPPGPDPRPYPGGPGNRSFVILALVAMALTWGIGIWAFVLRRQSGRS